MCMQHMSRPDAGDVLRCVVCVDSTNLWRASATRGDVALMWHAPAAPSSHGPGERWSTWFVFQGGEDWQVLTALDKRAYLDHQVQQLQGSTINIPGIGDMALQCFLLRRQPP